MTQQLSENLPKKVKPRALVFMANQKDLEKIKDFVKTLSDVKLVYLTTGSSSTTLRVIKEQNNKQPYEKALFTLDLGI